MITRIVKITLKPDNIEAFKTFFYSSQKLIREFEGCNRVDLLTDTSNECIFFTFSYWNSEQDLNEYRKSYLFKSIWSKVKPLFSEKAEAWSLISP